MTVAREKEACSSARRSFSEIQVCSFHKCHPFGALLSRDVTTLESPMLLSVTPLNSPFTPARFGWHLLCSIISVLSGESRHLFTSYQESHMLLALGSYKENFTAVLGGHIIISFESVPRSRKSSYYGKCRCLLFYHLKKLHHHALLFSARDGTQDFLHANRHSTK